MRAVFCQVFILTVNYLGTKNMPVPKPRKTGVGIIGTPVAQWLGKFGMYGEMGEGKGKNGDENFVRSRGKMGKNRLCPADRDGFFRWFSQIETGYFYRPGALRHGSGAPLTGGLVR